MSQKSMDKLNEPLVKSVLKSFSSRPLMLKDLKKLFVSEAVSDILEKSKKGIYDKVAVKHFVSELLNGTYVNWSEWKLIIHIISKKEIPEKTANLHNVLTEQSWKVRCPKPEIHRVGSCLTHSQESQVNKEKFDKLRGVLSLSGLTAKQAVRRILKSQSNIKIMWDLYLSNKYRDTAGEGRALSLGEKFLDFFQDLKHYYPEGIKELKTMAKSIKEAK